MDISVLLSMGALAGVFGFLGKGRRKDDEDESADVEPSDGAPADAADAEQALDEPPPEGEARRGIEGSATAAGESPAEGAGEGAGGEIAEQASPEQEVARLEQEIHDLRTLTQELETQLRQYRRWANDQINHASERLGEAWVREKLPRRVHEITEPPDPEAVERVSNVAHLLQQWVDELGLGDAEVFHRIGLWLAVEGRNEEAAAAFQKAVQRGMGTEGWLALGDIRWTLDRRKKARDAYRQCKEMKRAPAHVFYRSASVAFEEYRFADALADLDRVLSRAKPGVEVYVLNSRVRGKLKEFDEAVAILEAGLEKHPEDPLLMAEMVIPLARSGQRERAEEVYAKARELDPELAEAPFALAVVHMDEDRTDEASALLEEALDLRSEYPEALLCLGVLHNRKGDHQNALEYFKMAIEVKPDYAEAYYNMKDAYDGLRDFENSIAMLEKAVQLNPEYR